jgi:hypothetical protein
MRTEAEIVEGDTVSGEAGHPSSSEIVVKDQEPRSAVPSHVEPQATSLLGLIERVASDPNIDIERMQALLTMRAQEEERQRRITREDEAEHARRQFLAAFSLVQAEIGPISRSQSNTHTKSKYADLADIERVVSPILTKHGFSTTSAPVPCELNSHIRMRLTIGHSGGHERVYEDDFPVDAAGSGGTVNKTGIQAKGSTQSYARRYLKASALDLAFTDDQDGNATKPGASDERPISAAKLKNIRRELADLGGDEEGFCQHFGIDRMEDLPDAMFADACTALSIKRGQQVKAEEEAAASEHDSQEAA